MLQETFELNADINSRDVAAEDPTPFEAQLKFGTGVLESAELNTGFTDDQIREVVLGWQEDYTLSDEDVNRLTQEIIKTRDEIIKEIKGVDQGPQIGQYWMLAQEKGIALITKIKHLFFITLLTNEGDLKKDQNTTKPFLKELLSPKEAQRIAHEWVIQKTDRDLGFGTTDSTNDTSTS